MRTRFILKVLLGLLVFSASVWAKELPEKEDSYTINFNNVPAIEYIRFASKICTVNFLFNETELNFNVSVISKDEITPKNVMATLVQILRIHGLLLLEQEGNLVIHRNPDVKQIAKIISEKNKDQSAPIVTRVFSIKNVRPESLSNIIRPMISAEALLEVLSENRQLIITDFNANIQKIAELIEIVDSPQNPLAIEIYKVKQNDPEYLIGLANQIMGPMAEGNPFILVPQVLNGTIYIVSTPKLIEKALSVLASLDSPARDETKKVLKAENVFIYKPERLNRSEIERSLDDIAKTLSQSGFAESGLIEIVKSRKWIKDTRTFLFTGTPEAITKLTEILSKIDRSSTGKIGEEGDETFFTYKPENRPPEEIAEAIKEIGDNLKKSRAADNSLIETINSVKIVSATQSLMFTGLSSTFEKIKELLASIDLAGSKGPEKSNYFLYRLKHVSGAVIEEDLDNFVDKLKTQHLKNPELIRLIENAKWIKETNSLLITGTPKAIQEAKDLIAEYDVPRSTANGSSDNFFIYKPQFASPAYIEKSLKDISLNLQRANLSDPSLLSAIQSMKFIDSTNSLAFTGSKETIEKIKNLLNTIDVPSAMPSFGKTEGKSTYLLYQIKNANYQQLITSLRAFASDLKSTSTDPSFIGALDSLKYKSETNALLFTGSPEALEKVRAIVERFDVASLSDLPQNGASAFFIYKPKHLSGPALENVLKEFSEHLKTTGFTDNALFIMIQNMRWVEKSESLVFSGDNKTIDELKNLLATFDVPGKDTGAVLNAIQPIEDTSFLVYKLQYHKGDEIQTALKQIAKEMIKNEAQIKQELLASINSIQWIRLTNSLLCSGKPELMGKLKELIQSLDVPLKQVFIEILVVETSLTNLLSFGLDWGSKMKYKDRFTAGTSNQTSNTAHTSDTFMTNLSSISESTTPQSSMIPFTDAFDLGIIGDIILHKGRSFLSMGSFIKALQTDDESSVVMTPKILTQDNKTATIFIGSNIPYLGSQTAIVGGATSSTTQNLEYRDVGMDLSLTPVLGGADIVTLDINLKRTVVDSSTSAASSTVSGITTSKTTMQTTVHMPDKNFLVLSGMVTETKTKKRVGVPCLGGLPWIGAAFSERDNLEDRRNVVIFIRPHIINSYQDMVAITETQEDYFREKTGSPVLEQEFDEAAEMLKAMDNE
ncbi:MAG: secretin N-terminal domain-containing protein [Parachlamydiales bacterium]|jgi:type II secretion system protein D